MEVPAGLVAGEDPFPGLWTVAFYCSLCSLRALIPSWAPPSPGPTLPT